MRRLILILCLCLAACHVKGGIVHQVEKGESLIQISHAYGVSLDEILYANRIQNPNQLKVGDKLLIPGVRRHKNVKKFVWEHEVPSHEPKKKISPPRKPIVSKNTPRKTPPVTKGTLKFIWPAKGRLLAPFGMQNNRMHNGIDLSLKPNQAIKAAMEGVVVYRGDQVDGYGNMLILRHPDNLFSVYAYLGDFKVEKGTEVSQGQVIAHASRRKNFAFIHFEIRRGKHAVDPLTFLPK